MFDTRNKFFSPAANKQPGSEPIEVESQPVTPEGRLVYKIDSTPSDTLVIHCVDPRFQTAFRRFITEELGVANYTPIVIGGGVHALSAQAFMPKNFKILWEQVKFYVKDGSLRRIIFINHQDCRWYEKMHGHFPKLNLPLKGKEDLQSAAEIIMHDFTGIGVESYFAHLDGDEVTFERVM